MKTACLLATLLASAAAFAPSKSGSSSSALSASPFENELGAQDPIGFIDPLGLVESGDKAQFDRLRYVELKHGRIAMLAVVGYLVTDAGIRLPGLIAFDGTTFADIPSGFDALTAIPTAGLGQLILFIGLLEARIMKDITGGEFPGDFRNGYIDYGWDKFDAATKFKKRAIELNNGRAAQFGILGLMVHEKIGVSLLPAGAVH